MQFVLLYYLHMSISDYNHNDIRDNEWIYGRFVQQRKEEIEAKKKANASRS